MTLEEYLNSILDISVEPIFEAAYNILFIGGLFCLATGLVWLWHKLIKNEVPIYYRDK